MHPPVVPPIGIAAPLNCPQLCHARRTSSGRIDEGLLSISATSASTTSRYCSRTASRMLCPGRVSEFPKSRSTTGASVAGASVAGASVSGTAGASVAGASVAGASVSGTTGTGASVAGTGASVTTGVVGSVGTGTGGPVGAGGGVGRGGRVRRGLCASTLVTVLATNSRHMYTAHFMAGLCGVWFHLQICVEICEQGGMVWYGVGRLIGTHRTVGGNEEPTQTTHAPRTLF